MRFCVGCLSPALLRFQMGTPKKQRLKKEKKAILVVRLIILCVFIRIFIHWKTCRWLLRVLRWSPSHYDPHCPATTVAVLLEMSEEVVVPIAARAHRRHRAPAQGFPVHHQGLTIPNPFIKDQEEPPKNQGSSLQKKCHLLGQNLPRSTKQPPLGRRRRTGRCWLQLAGC